ncbi:MAG TPA: SsrA-binding protein SmpB [Alphaproteobacteria bacterium]|nr:SsrA-binding protein SmpB [Alphaproteobacteria bacterium]
MNQARQDAERIAAQNRRARHDYFIEETVEAGVVLAGSEVKALREGRGNLNDAYAQPREGGLWLLNAYIPEYRAANRFNHETRRARKLLLHKRQIERLSGLVRREGATLVPLKIYFNARGIAKVELGLAHGKRKQDKRATEKEREWKRDKARILRAKG